MSKYDLYLSPDRLKEVLDQAGLRIVYETATDIACYCCFHDNRDSPAFNISKRGSHLWKCWNGKCQQQGNIFSLLTKKGYTNKEAKKILMFGVEDPDQFAERIKELLNDEKEETENEWSNSDIQRFRQDDEAHDFVARNYLSARGIGIDAYDHFQIGFSSRKRMAVVPMLNEYDQLVGIIGRSVDGKRYQYSHGSPRSGIVWNLQNAKKLSDEIILTEGALDSVYIWQAGYQNVGAVLGSSIAALQWNLLRKYFSSIVCFFDNDNAGNSLRDSILENCTELFVSTVTYPDRLITLQDGSTRAPKDPGELSETEIRYMLAHKKTSIELLLEKDL